MRVYLIIFLKITNVYIHVYFVIIYTVKHLLIQTNVVEKENDPEKMNNIHTYSGVFFKILMKSFEMYNVRKGIMCH